MITGTLRNLTPVLFAVVMCAGNCHSVCALDDSQRPLPFPAKEAAEPGVHLELLKRLRSTITDAQQDSSPREITAPRNAPAATDSQNSDSLGGSPSQPQPAVDEPTPPSASALQQLGDLLKNIKDQLPKGMIPPALEQLPQEDMKKGLQAPETQQKLRDLMQQFRKDGMLPPEADQGTPTKPLPVPPPATNKAVPRGSLKALDEFLRKLQQQATVPGDDSTQPRSEPEQPSAEDAAPQTRGNPREPLRRRDSVPGPRVPATPETQPAPQAPNRPSAPDAADTSDAADPAELPGDSGAADTSRGSMQPRGSRKNETQTGDSQQSEPVEPGVKPPSTSTPGASEGELPSEPGVKSPPDREDSFPGQTGSPQSAPPDKGRNPLRFRPQPGRTPSANGGLPSEDSVERRSESQADNSRQSAPRSAMDSLQQLMREMSQQLSGNTSRADSSTSEQAPQSEAIPAAPRSGQPLVPAPAPAPEKLPRTSPQNPGVSGNGAGQARENAPVQRNNDQVPPAVAGPRAQIQSGPRESASTTNPSAPGQQPRSSTPSQETAEAPFSVEQFLNDQLQDPALRSAAESPEARRLLEQIMGQSGAAPDAGSGGNSEPGIAQRGDDPADSSASRRSNKFPPRPQDGTPQAPSTDPRNAQPDSNNGFEGRGNDANDQRRQSEGVGKQLQKQGFAGTLRQIVEEARREAEEQRQRQEEEALAQSQAESTSPAESSPGAADSPNAGTPAAPSGPASSAWDGRERTGDRPPFDPKAALEMLDRFSENMERQAGQRRANSDQEMSPEGGAGLERPAPQNGNALDRMRDLAGSLLSDRPAPIVPAPAASAEDSAALTQPGAPTSFDWTPALILGGILAALMLLIPVVRRLQSRVGVNEELRTAEIALAPHEIRTRQDIVRAFHQLAKRCSRSVRPWWNHLQVATELSRVIPDRQQTVSELSAVYERARYQPLDHELTPAELAAAQMAIRKCAATPG